MAVFIIFYAMRRKLELIIGTLLLLVLLAGVPTSWKLSVSLVSAIILIIFGLINPRKHSTETKDAAFVEHGPLSDETPK